MSKHMPQSKVAEALAAQQTHSDMHCGRGVVAGPTHNEIASRAYDIYVKQGHKQGQCKQNWQQAEHDLRTGDRKP